MFIETTKTNDTKSGVDLDEDTQWQKKFLSFYFESSLYNCCGLSKIDILQQNFEN